MKLGILTEKLEIGSKNYKNYDEIEIDDEIKIIDKISEGFPFAILEDLINANKFSRMELFKLFLPARTFSRRKREKRLTSEESDIITRLINLIEFAEEVFEDKEKAKEWLRRPNRSLKNRKPIDLLKTDLGTRMVENVLGRIAYGIY